MKNEMRWMRALEWLLISLINRNEEDKSGRIESLRHFYQILLISHPISSHPSVQQSSSVTRKINLNAKRLNQSNYDDLNCDIKNLWIYSFNFNQKVEQIETVKLGISYWEWDIFLELKKNFSFEWMRHFHLWFQHE